MKRIALSLLTLVVFAACQSVAPVPATAPTTSITPIVTPDDPHSFSNPDEVVVRTLALGLHVDFARKVLDGVATLGIENKTGANKLVLDVRDLTIRRITLDTGREVNGELGAPAPFLGQSLTIPLEPNTRSVKIEYATSPNAAAVQWLDPEQTADRKMPFLFTQSQAVLARTWVPIQDTPAVRFTYSATVTVPKGMMAVMSAENPTARSADGVYRFTMPQPIPSYLLALAVGDIDFRSLGRQAGVYAEPSVVEKAAWELADTQKMIDATEEMYGPYRWGRYDILVLPPSFPFGGMENPKLTFATPTILAGDRSLVSLVAHELAHSWSGNLVTNATWNDFWLNEGFTTYIENRIMEKVYGKPYADMLASLGMQSLRETINDLGATSPDTRLKVDFGGRDPDEGVSDIAYEKGRFLLMMLEQAVGRETFDRFIRNYFDSYAFRSVTTEDFLNYARRTILAGKPELEARVNEWIYQPGLPASAPVIAPERFAAVDRQVSQFVGGGKATDLQTKDWSTHEWLHFLRALPANTPAARMAELDAAFKLSNSGNSEILFQWLMNSIRTNYEAANPALERFLMTVGRRKFVRPLYAELAKTPAGKQRALEIYRRARVGYHTVTRASIDKDLGFTS